MNNLLNKQDEFDEFNEGLLAASAGPDDVFVENLLKKMEDTAKESKKPANNFVSFFTGSKLRLMLTGVITLSLFAGVLGGGYLAFRSISNNPVMSDQQLLAAIAQARQNSENTKRAASPHTGSQETAAASTSLMADASLRIYLPDNTFTYFKTTTAHGPKVAELQKCNQYMAAVEGSTENYNHQSSNPRGRYVSYDKSGKLLSETISDNNSITEYQGGSFAVRTIEDRNYLLAARTEPMIFQEGDMSAQTAPAQTIPAPAEDLKIEDYFGPDTKVEGKEVIAGKEYHIVSWKGELGCDNGSNLNTIYKTWYDVKDFSTFKTEQYLRAISAENLLLTEQFENETRVVNFSEVASKFNSTHGKSVKQLDLNAINATVKQAYADKLANYASTQSFSFVVPAGNYSVGGASSDFINIDNSPIYQAKQKMFTRDFWASGSEGDRAFAENKQMLEQQLIDSRAATQDRILFSTNYTFANNEQYAYVNVFNSSSNISSILQEMYGLTTSPTKSYTQNLGSIQVSVDEYLQGMFIEGATEASEASGGGNDSVVSIEQVTSCPADKTCRAGLIRVIKSGSYTYVVSEDVKITGGAVNSVGLSVIESNSVSYQAFLNQIKEAVKKERTGMIAL
jgi:hypothetical protein